MSTGLRKENESSNYGCHIEVDFPENKDMGDISIKGNTRLIRASLAFICNQLIEKRGVDKNDLINTLSKDIDMLANTPHERLVRT